MHNPMNSLLCDRSGIEATPRESILLPRNANGSWPDPPFSFLMKRKCVKSFKTFEYVLRNSLPFYGRMNMSPPRARAEIEKLLGSLGHNSYQVKLSSFNKAQKNARGSTVQGGALNGRSRG